MKKFIKNIDWSGILLCALFAALCLLCWFGSCTEAHADDTLQGKCIVITQPKKAQPTDTGYTIQVDNKTYKVWRGARGGCYYIKDGKKVYLTKKQKALIK